VSRHRGSAGRALLACYALLAVAAGARAGVQLATHPDRAPLAYGLSAGAAAVYLAAGLALAAQGPAARRVAAGLCSLELAGVLAVGTLGWAAPGRFPDATVWSGYGSGYGFVPLVLPVAGLVWLALRARRRAAAGEGPADRASLILGP
jgi:hypothetical protein